MTKTLIIDVDGIVPYKGQDAALRGQVTVKYFDASNWVITSIGVDLFHEKELGVVNPREIIPQIADLLDPKIEQVINEAHQKGA
jgi:hypothetical protein